VAEDAPALGPEVELPVFNLEVPAVDCDCEVEPVLVGVTDDPVALPPVDEVLDCEVFPVAVVLPGVEVLLDDPVVSVEPMLDVGVEVDCVELGIVGLAPIAEEVVVELEDDSCPDELDVLLLLDTELNVLEVEGDELDTVVVLVIVDWPPLCE